MTRGWSLWRRATRRLRVEPLEDRRLLAALLVNSPLDNTVSGDGLVTLREAIHAADNDTTTDLGHKGSFADTISFEEIHWDGSTRCEEHDLPIGRALQHTKRQMMTVRVGVPNGIHHAESPTKALQRARLARRCGSAVPERCARVGSSERPMGTPFGDRGQRHKGAADVCSRSAVRGHRR